MLSSFFKLVFILSVAIAAAAVENNQQRFAKLDETVSELSLQVSSVVAEVSSMTTQLSSLATSVSKVNLQMMKIESDKGNNDASLKMEKDLEEDIKTLEKQMMKVQNEIRTVANDVGEMDSNIEDMETQVKRVKSEQDLQKQKLSGLEEDKEQLEETINTMEESVYLLKADYEDKKESNTKVIMELLKDVLHLDGNVTDLKKNYSKLSVELADLGVDFRDVQKSVKALDSRLSSLEMEGTIAFHASLGWSLNIPKGTTIRFQRVTLNLGEAYKKSTGQFMVPPGGQGLYYGYIQLKVRSGKEASFQVKHNDSILCSVSKLKSDGTASQQALSCGFAVKLDKDDVVEVVYTGGTDSLPLDADAEPYNSFAAFRIAPENLI